MTGLLSKHRELHRCIRICSGQSIQERQRSIGIIGLAIRTSIKIAYCLLTSKVFNRVLGLLWGAKGLGRTAVMLCTCSLFVDGRLDGVRGKVESDARMRAGPGCRLHNRISGFSRSNCAISPIRSPLSGSVQLR